MSKTIPLESSGNMSVVYSFLFLKLDPVLLNHIKQQHEEAACTEGGILYEKTDLEKSMSSEIL